MPVSTCSTHVMSVSDVQNQNMPMGSCDTPLNHVPQIDIEAPDHCGGSSPEAASEDLANHDCPDGSCK